jgi:hypothetical protein
MKKIIKFIKNIFGLDFVYYPYKFESFRKDGYGKIQAYSYELSRWCDIDFLRGTNYDGGMWNKM